MLVVLISTWSYLPPQGFAATNEDEARWFIGLVNKRNGKDFYVPAGKAALDVIKDFRNHVIANNLPAFFTKPGAIQILSRVYPCTNGQSLASREMSQVIGKQVTVQPTGVYATIDTSLMIATIQKLNATKDYENDGVIMRIETSRERLRDDLRARRMADYSVSEALEFLPTPLEFLPIP